MKLIVAVLAFAFLAGVALAADSNVQLAESLITRGDELILHTNQLLKEHRNHSLDHLVDTVEHELALVEALIFELKAEHAKENRTFTLQKIHLVEEELLHLENRISEELIVIEDAMKHQHLNQTADQLIAHAKTLVAHAKQVVQNHASASNRKEIASVEHEIHLIEQFVTQLEKKPVGEELKREEQSLVRSQQTLLHLIERIQARTPESKPHSIPATHETQTPV